MPVLHLKTMINLVQKPKTSTVSQGKCLRRVRIVVIGPYARFIAIHLPAISAV